MACDLCRVFPVRTLRQLDADLEDGKESLQELADRYVISIPLLEDHIKFCLTPLPTTGHELLVELLKEVKRVADERKAQHEQDPALHSAAMTHYVNLIRESRELVVAMERIKPSDELAQDIVNSILSPLVRQTILISADEAKRLRQEISEIIPPTKYRTLDKAIKEMLGRFSSRLNRETTELSDRLRKLLTDGPKTRRGKIADDSAGTKTSPPSIH